MKYRTKILRLVDGAAPLFEAESQHFSYHRDEYLDRFTATVSIEKNCGAYVRFRSFTVQNFHPLPSRYPRRLAFVVCHPELTSKHLFDAFSIDKRFGGFGSDVQFLREWVESERIKKAVFRSVRG